MTVNFCVCFPLIQISTLALVFFFLSSDTNPENSVSSQTESETRPELIEPDISSHDVSTTPQESSNSGHTESGPQTEPSTSLGYDEDKPFTDQECLNLVKDLFPEKDKKVHNKYLCVEHFCSDISVAEKQRLSPLKFSHNKLKDYWWLCFVEGDGMFCMLCKKLNAVHMLNKRDVFVNTPGKRYKALEDSLKTHAASYVHKSAIQTEL